jgi:predicted glutamine amidotransferase
MINSGVTKKEALEILANQYGENKDGVGEVYLKDGKFVVNKYAQSLEKVVKKGREFLSHLPHPGWTLIHIRRASCGIISKENAHPFVSMNGKIALIHNGTLNYSGLLRMYLSTIPGYVSDTDSAAATEIISRVGSKDFTERVNWGGVFCNLNLDGTLEVSKISGQLAAHMREDKSFILSSELNDDKYKNIELTHGYFKFDKDGKYLTHKVKPFEWNGYKKEEKVIAYEDWRGVHYQGGQAASIGVVTKEFPYDYD